MNYEKDKTMRMTFRLNESMSTFVKDHAKQLGISPADYVRNMILNAKITYDILSGPAKDGEKNENIISYQ